MVDVVFVLIALGFVLMCVAYVHGLDRMIGPDAPSGAESGGADASDAPVVAL